MNKRYIGVDIGGTSVKLGIVDDKGQVHLRKEVVYTEAGSSASVMDVIIKSIHELADGSIGIEAFSGIVGEIVIVQVQLGTVDKIDSRRQDPVLLLPEDLVELPGHGCFDADLGDILLCGFHGTDDGIGTVGRAQIKTQLVQPGFTQRMQLLFRGADAVCIHMLMDAGLMETADDAVVLLDFHEGFQIDIRDAGGLFLEGEKQGKVFLPIAGAADFPHAFPDGRDAVQQTVVIAERTGGVAAVCFPDGGQPAAQQAASAAGGETAFRADEERAGRERRRPGCAFRMVGCYGFQAGNSFQHFRPAGLHGGFDLPESGQGDFLLAAAGGFSLRQGGKKAEPIQGIFL